LFLENDLLLCKLIDPLLDKRIDPTQTYFTQHLAKCFPLF